MDSARRSEGAVNEEKDMADARAALVDYRASIDNIDAALIHMLAERFRCTKAVGELKASHGLPPADPAAADRPPSPTGEGRPSRPGFRGEVPELRRP
jgi:hypothetical protein